MLAAVLQQAAPMRNYLIHQGTLCIISNILSVLVPHLFYFILFLDPLYMYIYIYICSTFCLSLSFNSFLFTPSIFSSIFQFFLHPMFPSSTFLSQLYSLYSVLVYLPHLPISFPQLCITHFRNFDTQNLQTENSAPL